MQMILNKENAAIEQFSSYYDLLFIDDSKIKTDITFFKSKDFF